MPPYAGPYRLALPLKNIHTAPPGNSRRYPHVSAYILGDIDADDNARNGNEAYTIHRDKCDAAREMFQNSIECTGPVPVRYRAGRDSDWVVRFFENEINDRGPTDLMIIYVHVESRGNGLEYNWYVIDACKNAVQML